MGRHRATWAARFSTLSYRPSQDPAHVIFGLRLDHPTRAQRMRGIQTPIGMHERRVEVCMSVEAARHWAESVLQACRVADRDRAERDAGQ